MKISTTIALAALAVAIALATGYWAGARSTTTRPAPAAQSAHVTGNAKPERRILFYRNPMGLPDTSQVPKKDQMGMDYIPVREGDEDNGGQITISTDKIQKLGVRVEAAALRDLSHTVRAVGRIEANERLTYTIAPKFEGWIERLHVNTTGQAVHRGQPLFEVYSPELVSAQQEYAIASEGQRALAQATPEARAGMKDLAESSLARLKNWDISAEQLQSSQKSPQARHTLTFRAPVDGVVIEKKATQGMRFTPGEALYQIADLSSVWIVADVFEQDIARVRIGETATIRLNAYPGKEFTAKVSYVYPTLNPQTRTVPVRLELANPGGLLKPAMYADVELATVSAGKVLAIPTSAVIDGGSGKKVLVELAQGRFEPRPVKLGIQDKDYAEVLEGLGEGEKVVVSANFLIDSESNLKAAFIGMSPAPAQPAAPANQPGER